MTKIVALSLGLSLAATTILTSNNVLIEGIGIMAVYTIGVCIHECIRGNYNE